MSVYFIGCAHLGHKNIGKYRPFVSSPEENSNLIIGDWQKRITKNDIVYCLGDTCFSKEALDLLGNQKGRKILLSGNHEDLVDFKDKCAVFEEIHGILKYKQFWLSHAPIHPDEIRGKKANIHAHVHEHTIMKKGAFGYKRPDPKYFNTCVDVIYPKYKSVFVSLEDIRKMYP